MWGSWEGRSLTRDLSDGQENKSLRWTVKRESSGLQEPWRMRGIQVRSVYLPSGCFLFTAQLKATRSFCAVMLECSEEREPSTPLQNLGPCREQRSWSPGRHGRQTPSALHCLIPDLPVFPTRRYCAVSQCHRPGSLPGVWPGVNHLLPGGVLTVPDQRPLW